MRELTSYQKQFLLNCFFKNEKYPGWKSIATTLLETGKCIVSGNNCIWIGGIGNFIKTEEAKDAISCLLYQFDLEGFLETEWYKSVKSNYASILFNKKVEIEQELEKIEQESEEIAGF